MPRIIPLALALAAVACVPAESLTDGTSSGTDGSGSTGWSSTGTGTVTGTTPSTSTLDIDDDGDGYTENEGDCDDENADVNPDGDEGDVADGVDDDCTGTADDRLVCPGEVDAHYSTIQSGIDDAPDDFTLTICPGLYGENLSLTRRVHLASTDGPEVTTVQAIVPDTVLYISGVRNGGTNISGLTITGGANYDGAGVWARNSEVYLSGNIIEGNHAENYGGGVYYEATSGALTENVIQDNSALHGGGLFVKETDPDIVGNSFVGNEATTTDENTWSSGGGGGGALVYADSNIRDNTFEGNLSQYNGGGLYVLYADGEITGNTFTGNTSVEDGGGVYANRGTALFDSNTISGNEAYDDAGGMRVYVGEVTISNNEFIENLAGDDAGGLKLSHSSNVLIGNDFLYNETGDAGGGLELDNDTTTVTDCYFEGNEANRGGGMHSWRNEGAMTLSNLSFHENNARVCGGAMQFDNDPHHLVLIGIEATGNTAVDGAAICVDLAYQDDAGTIYTESDIALYNGLLVGNEAVDDGGALYVKAGHLAVTNTTITDNYGGSGTAAAVKEDGSLAIDSSIIASNDGDDAIFIEDNGAAAVSYTDIWDSGGFYGMSDPTGTGGNIEEDPDFVDPYSDDFSLSGGSPCIDAGAPTIEDTDGSRADMGHTGGPNGT